MTDDKKNMVALCFALGVVCYASDEYVELSADLKKLGALTEKMHKTWALLEPPGVILNPKGGSGFLFFDERVFAEAYMAGLIQQMQPLGGGFGYTLAEMVDPAIDGIRLAEEEFTEAEREKKLPSYMKMIDGGIDAEERGEKLLEAGVRADPDVRVPEEGVLCVLRADSDDRGGVWSDQAGHEEDVQEGTDGQEEGA